MKIPTIHLNGTSKDALLDALAEALVALFNAERALEATAPNGRDYYPQGPDALTIAAREHRTRVDALVKVRHELVALMEAIDEAAS